MTVLRHLCFSLLFITLLESYPAADPPFMWYATYSINDYDGNGACGRVNLERSHQEAAAFSSVLESMNLPNTLYRYNRRDSDCRAYRWTGAGAEVNQVDFVFYAGHGCGTGPIFGCNSGYPISCKDDIRFGGTGYLKWVQAASCSWFTPEQYDDCQSGLSIEERWKSCFTGVHAVMGHAAFTYENEYPQEAARQFWNDWCLNGEPIWWAWRNSQVISLYDSTGCIGLDIATLAPSSKWGLETFENAVDDPAPAPIGNLWLVRSVVGYPIYKKN